jgi:hypothetical protein
VVLLEAELRKLKMLYTEVLKKPEAASSIKGVRRQIKGITGRINMLNTAKAIH